MKIKFNEKEESIEINDNLKKRHLTIKILLILNVINSILFSVSFFNKKQLEWIGIFWIIIGLVSLVLLIYKIMKKSTSEKFHLSEITLLIEKQIFGRKKFSLKLKNGKLRDLIEIKDESDIIETKELFNKIGIKTS